MPLAGGHSASRHKKLPQLGQALGALFDKGHSGMSSNPSKRELKASPAVIDDIAYLIGEFDVV
jgi:hypothetical protein